MQTFLPYADFRKSAAVLDRQRLGKQRVEAWMLLQNLAGESKGWKNHPAVKMWRGHERSLIEYALAMCEEWVRRGYVDTRAPLIRAYRRKFPKSGPPPWLGKRAFHRSHQSNLVRKLPEHYRAYFPNVPDDLPYSWPAGVIGSPSPGR